MKIAVSTPTGPVGGKAVEMLRRRDDVSLVLLARHVETAPFADDPDVTVRRGDLADASYVRQATRDTDALLWIAPPLPASEDFRRDCRNLADNAAMAVDDNAIGRVVHLSSAGIDPGASELPRAFRDAEILLDQTTADVAHLRAGYLMEDFIDSMESAVEDGRIYLPVSGTVRLPMIACRDVASMAVCLLMDPTWHGKRQVTVTGPADVSFDEAATMIGEAIGQEVRHERVSPAQGRTWLLSRGYSNAMASVMLRMYQAIDSEPPDLGGLRAGAVVTPTTFEQFARTLAAAARQYEPAVPT